MIEAGSDRASTEEFIQFRAAGERVTGTHRCSECGYGVAVYTALPRCPMCGGETWEPSESRPFGRVTSGSTTAYY